MCREVVGVTLNFRDAARTAACIRSLLEDGVSRVLVWDNSGDCGVSADNLSRELGCDRRIHISTSHENLGFAAGVNAALAWLFEHWQADLVLLINNDARLMPGAVVQMKSAMESHRSTAMVCPAINHGGHVLGKVFYHRWLGLFSSRWVPGSICYASGCAMLIDMNETGANLFDEDFFMYGEDVELGWRIVRDGKRMVHITEVLVEHEGSASSGLGSPFYEARMVAAHLLLSRKLARNRMQAGVMLTGRLLLLPIRAAIRSIRYRSFIPWKALREGWKIAQGNDPLHRYARN